MGFHHTQTQWPATSGRDLIRMRQKLAAARESRITFQLAGNKNCLWIFNCTGIYEIEIISKKLCIGSTKKNFCPAFKEHAHKWYVNSREVPIEFCKEYVATSKQSYTVYVRIKTTYVYMNRREFTPLKAVTLMMMTRLSSACKIPKIMIKKKKDYGVINK